MQDNHSEREHNSYDTSSNVSFCPHMLIYSLMSISIYIFRLVFFGQYRCIAQLKQNNHWFMLLFENTKM